MNTTPPRSRAPGAVLAALLLACLSALWPTPGWVGTLTLTVLTACASLGLIHLAPTDETQVAASGDWLGTIALGALCGISVWRRAHLPDSPRSRAFTAGLFGLWLLMLGGPAG